MAKLPESIEIELSEKIQGIIESAKLMQQVETLAEVLSRESIKNVLLEMEFRHKYGLDRISNLSVICQHFYEKGLNDKV